MNSGATFIRTVAGVAVFSLAAACAAPRSEPARSSVTAAASERPLLGSVYLTIDGEGVPDGEEFVPPEHTRYLEVLQRQLHDAGLFADVIIASDATPADALVLDATIEADLDPGRSASRAALLLVVPVRTHGVVRADFVLKTAEHVLATYEFEEAVETRVVPVAELAGRTWVEKSGVLALMADRIAADLARRSERGTAVIASKSALPAARPQS